MKKLTLFVISLLFLTQAFSQAFSQESPSDYGTKFSMGIDIGNGGLIGMPMKVFIIETFAFEFGPHLRPVLDVDEFGLNIAFIGGPIFYFGKKARGNKRKIKMNGIFIKAGYSTGSLVKSTMVGLGWSMENFKFGNNRRSFNLELGLGNNFQTWSPSSNSYSSTDAGKNSQFMIWWKVGWNFFIGKK